MSAFSRRRDQVRLALMLLTRVPMGRIGDPVPAVGASIWAWPLAGALVGAGAGLVLWGALALGLPPLAAGLLALGATVLMTGGLHEDGLADTADGLGGGRDRARALDIMRDSRIGSYGVLALVMVCGLRAVLMGDLPPAPQTVLALALIGALSRAVLPLLLLAVPPAREDGLGRAARDGAGRRGAGAALGITAGAVALGLPGGPVVLLACGAAATVIAVLAWRRIGGITGDILGAAQVMSEVAALLALTLLLAL